LNKLTAVCNKILKGDLPDDMQGVFGSANGTFLAKKRPIAAGLSIRRLISGIIAQKQNIKLMMLFIQRKLIVLKMVRN
jgi:hypothetical protein